MSAGGCGRLLRASLRRLGGSGGPSWGLLAAPLRPWAAPGAGRLLGAFLQPLGGSWAPLGGSWKVLGPLWVGPGSVLGISGQLLGASWGGRLLGHCIKHRKNDVFYVFSGLRASPGGLWGDLLAALGCVVGSPGPSWAGLGVSPGPSETARQRVPGPSEPTPPRGHYFKSSQKVV